MLRVRVFCGKDYVFFYWCDAIPREGDYVERLRRDETGKVLKDRYQVRRVVHIVEEQAIAPYERASVAHLDCVALPAAEPFEEVAS